MIAAKKIYSRKDLVTIDEEPDGFVFATCNLCCGRSLENVKLDHEADCPLADPEVIGVDVVVRTVPREDICGDCPASGQSHCVVADWTLESHEHLRSMCSRYVVEDI